MNFEEYAPLAARTAKPLERTAQIEHAQLGVITEMGELADQVKRHVIYGKDLDITNFVEEVGDVMWYLALLIAEIGVQPRVINRAIEDAYDEAPEPDISLTEFVRMLAALGGALAAYKESNENPGQIATLLIGGLVQLLKRFDRQMSEAMEANINKLAKRYGDKYSDYAAVNRDVEAEREGLEADIKA